MNKVRHEIEVLLRDDQTMEDLINDINIKAMGLANDLHFEISVNGNLDVSYSSYDNETSRMFARKAWGLAADGSEDEHADFPDQCT